ncbi:hypothetical protein [Pilimelia columellifera]|uniref:Uncharacterized protein n=1 Tax=Pilimelia columellifera subsp. columellifera TaxID=706583 RepID=A0ABN3N5H4_9ACTN
MNRLHTHRSAPPLSHLRLRRGDTMTPATAQPVTDRKATMQTEYEARFFDIDPDKITA